MGVSSHPLNGLNPLSPEELAEWEEAYAAVEAYLLALRLKNRLLVAELVRRILWRASERRSKSPDSPARLLAVEEALTEVAEWTQDVLNVPLENRRVAARGRLAMLLTDIPDRWQHVFLTPAPWPEDFVKAMNNAYLAAGPQFQQLTMTPRPLELNAFGSGAAHWWETMERKPIVGVMSLVIFISLVIFLTWFFLF